MDKIEQPKKLPTVESGKESDGKSLYDIIEQEGGFDVVLPGLVDGGRGWFVGTTRKTFATRAEAEQAVAKSREASRVGFEQVSLAKTFSRTFFRIDEVAGGKFRVVLPGLVDSKNGYYVGTTSKEFNSWDEAKGYFLQSRESQEQLTQKPLLQIQTSETEQIAFSEFDAYNPRPAPSETALAIPASVEKYLMGKGRMDGSEPNASTYQKTIEEPGWERKLFSFISSYLQNGGAELAKELGIEHLDALTPRQAVDLATRIVIDLTKYKWSDTMDNLGDLAKKPEKTNADQSSALKILQDGLAGRDNPNWEGNGICRNFASSVKAVFEALKANQTRFSQLQNTYCLYEGGMSEFEPRRENTNVTEMKRAGHAWNTFVTISKEGGADATIVDATWAKRNLDTKQIENLDYTLLRMESVVHAVGIDLSESAPNKAEQVEHLLSYYALKIESPAQPMEELPSIASLSEEERARFKRIAIMHFRVKYDLTQASDERLIDLGQRFAEQIRVIQQQDREREFFTTRALALMTRHGVPQELPPTLVSAINEVYKKLGGDADKTEIATIHQISRTNSSIDFSEILHGYLKEKPLSDHHANALMFADNDLQIMVFDRIKSHVDYEKLIKESPQFRIRMREAIPQLFLDFSPDTRPEDMAELIYLARQSQLLAKYESILDPRNPSKEKIDGFFDRARQVLRTLNREQYDATIARMDNYQLVKQYERLHRSLKG